MQCSQFDSTSKRKNKPMTELNFSGLACSAKGKEAIEFILSEGLDSEGCVLESTLKSNVHHSTLKHVESLGLIEWESQGDIVVCRPTQMVYTIIGMKSPAEDYEEECQAREASQCKAKKDEDKRREALGQTGRFEEDLKPLFSKRIRLEERLAFTNYGQDRRDKYEALLKETNQSIESIESKLKQLNNTTSKRKNKPMNATPKGNAKRIAELEAGIKLQTEIISKVSSSVVISACENNIELFTKELKTLTKPAKKRSKKTAKGFFDSKEEAQAALDKQDGMMHSPGLFCMGGIVRVAAKLLPPSKSKSKDWAWALCNSKMDFTGEYIGRSDFKVLGLSENNEDCPAYVWHAVRDEEEVFYIKRKNQLPEGSQQFTIQELKVLATVPAPKKKRKAKASLPTCSTCKKPTPMTDLHPARDEMMNLTLECTPCFEGEAPKRTVSAKISRESIKVPSAIIKAVKAGFMWYWFTDTTLLHRVANCQLCNVQFINGTKHLPTNTTLKQLKASLALPMPNTVSSVTPSIDSAVCSPCWDATVVSITDNEALMLQAIFDSDFNQDASTLEETVGVAVWTFSANPFDSQRTASGTASSLNKKQFAISYDSGTRDATIELTIAGVKALQQWQAMQQPVIENNSAATKKEQTQMAKKKKGKVSAQKTALAKLWGEYTGNDWAGLNGLRNLKKWAVDSLDGFDKSGLGRSKDDWDDAVRCWFQEQEFTAPVAKPAKKAKAKTVKEIFEEQTAKNKAPKAPTDKAPDKDEKPTSKRKGVKLKKKAPKEAEKPSAKPEEEAPASKLDTLAAKALAHGKHFDAKTAAGWVGYKSAAPTGKLLKKLVTAGTLVFNISEMAWAHTDLKLDAKKPAAKLKESTKKAMLDSMPPKEAVPAIKVPAKVEGSIAVLLGQLLSKIDTLTEEVKQLKAAPARQPVKVRSQRKSSVIHSDSDGSALCGAGYNSSGLNTTTEEAEVTCQRCQSKLATKDNEGQAVRLERRKGGEKAPVTVMRLFNEENWESINAQTVADERGAANPASYHRTLKAMTEKGILVLNDDETYSLAPVKKSTAKKKTKK